MPSTLPGLFITGTDTGVGKTYVAALIARALVAQRRRVGVYKPAASGCHRDEQGRLISDDAVALWEAAGQPGDLEHVCPQRFEAPLAPHLAARAEGKRLDPELLRSGLDYWRTRSDIVLVEGTGGLLSPLGEDEYVADLAYDFGLPLVVISRNVLGTINATLQTLVAAGCGIKARSASEGVFSGPRLRFGLQSPVLRVAGVVLNNPSPPSADDLSLATNLAELAARCVPPVLAEVAYEANRFDTVVDWFGLSISRYKVVDR